MLNISRKLIVADHSVAKQSILRPHLLSLIANEFVGKLVLDVLSSTMRIIMLRRFLVNIFVQLVQPVTVDRVTTEEWFIMVFVLYLM